MQLRRRFKQIDSLKDQLIRQAQYFRKQAEGMPAGIQREELLEKARQAETSAHVYDWLSSSGLQRPQ
jgi:hypothetical protein